MEDQISTIDDNWQIRVAEPVLQSKDASELACKHDFLIKGGCQKLLSVFFPLRGGDPPFLLSFFEHNNFPLRGGGGGGTP